MYMEWAKPYLRNIERLGGDGKKVLSPDIITAFEGSLIDIEFSVRGLPFTVKKL